MPRFDAANEYAPQPCEFDFRPWGVDAHGTIPEPSERDIREFYRTLNAVTIDAADAWEKSRTAALGDQSPTDPPKGDLAREVAERLPTVPEEKAASADSKKIVAAYAELCQRTPTATQIGKLPAAAQWGFFQYVLGQLINPEARRVGLRPSLNTDAPSTTSSEPASTAPTD